MRQDPIRNLLCCGPKQETGRSMYWKVYLGPRDRHVIHSTLHAQKHFCLLYSLRGIPRVVGLFVFGWKTTL